jgi:hypothetical protein
MAEQLDRSFGILARGLREMTAKVEAENAAWQEYITPAEAQGPFVYVPECDHGRRATEDR